MESNLNSMHSIVCIQQHLFVIFAPAIFIGSMVSVGNFSDFFQKFILNVLNKRSEAKKKKLIKDFLFQLNFFSIELIVGFNYMKKREEELNVHRKMATRQLIFRLHEFRYRNCLINGIAVNEDSVDKSDWLLKGKQ